jgi:hypothetical protein
VSDTYNGVCARVQAKLNDQEVRTYTPGFLLPYVNGAYEDVALGMIQAGDPQLRKRAQVTITATTGKIINAPGGTSPALPSDYLKAISLRERPSSPGTGPWVDMIDVRAIDDSSAQGATLNVWEPRGHTIVLVGATVNTDVQVDYFFKVAMLAAPGDVLLYDGALDLIAKIAAYRAGLSRGAPADLLTLLKGDYDLVMAALFGIQSRANVPAAAGK